MNVKEIKEKLTALAEASHKRDLSDPVLAEADPEGFILEYEALEIIIDHGIARGVDLPGFDKKQYLERYLPNDDDHDVYIFQDDFHTYLNKHFDASNESIDPGFREIVQHYRHEFRE